MPAQDRRWRFEIQNRHDFLTVGEVHRILHRLFQIGRFLSRTGHRFASRVLRSGTAMTGGAFFCLLMSFSEAFGFFLDRSVFSPLSPGDSK